MDIEKLCRRITRLIEESNVNLSRQSDRKQEFINDINQIIRKFLNKSMAQKDSDLKDDQMPTYNIKRLTPTKRNMIGDNVASMTRSESQKADEDFGSTPFGERNN